MFNLLKEHTMKKIDNAAVVLAVIGLINAVAITVLSYL